jgi:Zn finger protein HypA/HybF involved in hydrogenase expression
MNYTVKKVNIESEFKVCPTCDYEDGFHSMFKKEENKTKWFFICPSCHSVYDVGFTV